MKDEAIDPSPVAKKACPMSALEQFTSRRAAMIALYETLQARVIELADGGRIVEDDMLFELARLNELIEQLDDVVVAVGGQRAR
jgi:hypothetical protein